MKYGTSVYSQYSTHDLLINDIFAILGGLIVFSRLMMVRTIAHETWTNICIVVYYLDIYYHNFFYGLHQSCWNDMKTIIQIDISNITNNSTNSSFALYNEALQSMIKNILDIHSLVYFQVIYQI